MTTAAHQTIAAADLRAGLKAVLWAILPHLEPDGNAAVTLASIARAAGIGHRAAAAAIRSLSHGGVVVYADPKPSGVFRWDRPDDTHRLRLNLAALPTVTVPSRWQRDAGVTERACPMPPTVREALALIGVEDPALSRLCRAPRLTVQEVVTTWDTLKDAAHLYQPVGCLIRTLADRHGVNLSARPTLDDRVAELSRVVNHRRTALVRSHATEGRGR